jgi:hypothetical protein
MKKNKKRDIYDVRWEYSLEGESPEDVIRYVVLQLLQHPDFPAPFFTVRNRTTGEVIAKDFTDAISKDK